METMRSALLQFKIASQSAKLVLSNGEFWGARGTWNKVSFVPDHCSEGTQ